MNHHDPAWLIFWLVIFPACSLTALRLIFRPGKNDLDTRPRHYDRERVLRGIERARGIR